MSGFLQDVKIKYDEMLIGINPVIDNWPLMKSPIPVLTILGLYLYFILKSGPKYMKNRQPFNIQTILIVYNGYQVIFSAWLCAQAFNVDKQFIYIFDFSCEGTSLTPDDEFAMALWHAAWWYFFSKIVDLLDTVFFVLRKKQEQVTFLHVYHHFITCLFSWGYLKYLPGEQGAIIGFLNSFVHVIMYFYYMVAAMGPAYQKYIWWKKYLTWIQLLQFSLMLTYLVTIILLDCRLSRSLTFFFVGNVVVFLALFTNFYRTAYSKKQQIMENGIVAKEQNGSVNGTIVNEQIDMNNNNVDEISDKNILKQMHYNKKN